VTKAITLLDTIRSDNPTTTRLFDAAYLLQRNGRSGRRGRSSVPFDRGEFEAPCFIFVA
jgi:hypothetical protein